MATQKPVQAASMPLPCTVWPASYSIWFGSKSTKGWVWPMGKCQDAWRRLWACCAGADIGARAADALALEMTFGLQKVGGGRNRIMYPGEESSKGEGSSEEEESEGKGKGRGKDKGKSKHNSNSAP